jgi:hypothetical protein
VPWFTPLLNLDSDRVDYKNNIVNTKHYAFCPLYRRSGTPVTVTNYINQHKKSTGFRDVPVVFKTRSWKSGQPFRSPVAGWIGNGLRRRPFPDHLEKNPSNNLILFWKNQSFYRKNNEIPL